MSTTLTAPAAPDRPAGRAAEALEHGLPLVWLAALAAVVDLAWNRVAIVGLGGTDDDTALWLLRTGPFWRNLAAVAGLCALVTGLFTYLRMAGFAAPLRRVQVAGLAGLLVPALALAAAVPKESLPSVVVLLTVGVANALVVVFGVTAGGYFKSPYRAGVWGGALVSVLVLVLLVAASMESLQLWLSDGSDLGGKIAWGLMVGCRVGGELLWLSTPVVVARWLLPEVRTPASRAVAAAVALAVVGVAVLGEASRHTDHSVVAYGAFRVQLLSEELVGLYALPVGAVLGVGVATLATGSPLARQVGAYLLLWVAAGFAPRTPIQVLYLTLAIVSIARAVQASDPEGRRRAELRWGQGLEPPEPLTVPVADVPAATGETAEPEAGGGAEPESGAEPASGADPESEAELASAAKPESAAQPESAAEPASAAKPASEAEPASEAKPAPASSPAVDPRPAG